MRSACGRYGAALWKLRRTVWRVGGGSCLGFRTTIICGVLKERFCFSMVAKGRWTIRTITGEIANTVQLQALNNGMMKLGLWRYVSIPRIPVSGRSPNAHHALVVHHTFTRRIELQVAVID